MCSYVLGFFSGLICIDFVYSSVQEEDIRYLYEKTTPDLIIDMRINRFIAMWRFTLRFIKAKKLNKEFEMEINNEIYDNLKLQFDLRLNALSSKSGGGAVE